MAPNPERKELREIGMRLKVKTEELSRLKEEVKALKEQRSALKAAIAEPETAE